MTNFILTNLRIYYHVDEMTIFQEKYDFSELKQLLLQLLSHFSRVQLCATPQIAAHQAPLSLVFSRQEYWSGLPFPPPMHESESEVAQSCLTLSDPMDCSLSGSSIHGVFQARVLEWIAIAFSGTETEMRSILLFTFLKFVEIPFCFFIHSFFRISGGKGNE